MVVAQCQVNHDGAKVRTADTDVDDGGDVLASVTIPLLVAEGIGEAMHTVENFVDVGHDIAAINDEFRIAGKA